MNGDVTVREVMRREFVGASESDTVRDAATLMLEESVGSVVVLRGSESVGMVTQRDVLQAAVAGRDLGTVIASDVMSAVGPQLAPGDSLTAATDAMAGTETRHLLVVDDGEPVGVISEHDILMASTLDHAVESEGGRQAHPEAMTTEAVTATTEGTATEEEFSNQGICEVCGTLTRDLSSFNGQLVCSDCKDV